MFKPSEQQLAIFDGAKKGENLIINAGPGSGKSTTLVQQVHELPDDKNILLVVFNNATAKELNEKMPNNCVVSTAHKLGYSMAYKKYEFNKWLHGDYGDLSKKINQVFFFKLLDNGFSHKEANQFLIYLSEVISKLRLTLTDYNNEEAVINTLTHYNLPYERPDLIKWCMEEMINAYHNKGWVDFDDMIYLPVALNMSPIGKTFKDLNGKSRLLSSFDIILLDEAQDLSFAYLKLLDIIISSNTNMQIIAVGDEHQAINGFNGSSPDAMQIIQNHYNLKPYDLTISYRCPKEHLDYINDLFGTKLTSGNNRTGVIHNILFDDIINYIEIGDLIISRNQRGKDAKLLPVMKMLVNNQIPCRLLGFDLVSIAKKQFNKSFKKKALVWDIFYQAEQEIIELRETLMEKKYSPDIIESVVENGQMVVDLLQFFIDKYSNKKWEDFIDWLYQLENVKSSAVTLSTIHKSKGAEATNVYILDSKKLPAIREPSQEWEKKQESNLQYVALSRSLENLYFVN